MALAFECGAVFAIGLMAHSLDGKRSRVNGTVAKRELLPGRVLTLTPRIRHFGIEGWRFTAGNLLHATDWFPPGKSVAT